MDWKLKASGVAGGLLLAAISASPLHADPEHNAAIHHVLLISIDGMHALDFENCAKGISTVNRGAAYCSNLAELAERAVTYTQASTAKPSDSFPGLLAEITGGSPRSAGVFYDVSYDRALSPPAQTTPGGVTGGATLCPGTVGTVVGYDEFIDMDYTKLNGGGGINPNFLPRDPSNGCAPVFPHQFLRVNTVFEVVKAAGGYTAWTDKHPAYEIVKGPSGNGLNDFYGPEINSLVVPLRGVTGCELVPDTAATDAWTSSFQNIQCYDTLHTNAVIHQINGRTHDGAATAPVPTVFGTNFQAVSVGQKLHEGSTTGGYIDALGTPSPALLSEIEFVDRSIGVIVSELKHKGLYDSTLIIVTAKHGQSPIDPSRVLRIPHDNHALQAPSDILGSLVAGSIEDDVALLWLTDQRQTSNAVNMLTINESVIGGGEIFAGESLKLMFNDPGTDSRTPDIIVTPNVGVVYTGGAKKIAEHGGFAHDDTNVMLLVAYPTLSRATIASPVETAQVAPTILQSLGLDPGSLQAVRQEHTSVLPGLHY